MPNFSNVESYTAQGGGADGSIAGWDSSIHSWLGSDSNSDSAKTGGKIGGAVGGIFGDTIGGWAKGAGNLVGGWFGKSKTPEERGGGLYDGLQQPGAEPLDANAITQRDAQVFADLANRYGLWVQEVNTILEYDLKKSGNSWMQFVNWYRDHMDGFAQLMSEYNAANPSRPIRSHALGTPTGTVSNSAMQGYNLANGSTATGQNFRATVDTETLNGGSNNTPATSHTTTYALIGGGLLVVVVALVIFLKK